MSFTTDSTLAFIGGGNMARSLIGGLLARGIDAQRIVVADPVAAALEALQERFDVNVAQSNAVAVQSANVVILAVKPQEMHRVVAELAPTFARTAPLIISVAAGIRASDIQRWSGGMPIVRCMPNRPALQGCGMTGLFATPDVSAERRALVVELMSAVGATLWVDHETQMDAVTALSGSGPAYFFLLIEMLEQTGVTLGLSPAVSHRLAVETAYGSGLMAREASESPATLRQQVTSKGGTTAAALEHLEAHDVRAIFAAAVTAAARRSAELADEFGANQ
jgi:pyrroline-5-carboxylate reductase